MSLSVVPEPSDSTAEFIDYLYDGLEGYIYSPTIERGPNGEPGPFTQHFFQWPTERDELLSHIVTNSEQRDVYVAPAVFDAPNSHKQHFKATNVVWTEFDGVIPSDLREVPVPSLRVRSSTEGFEHWYWKLSTPGHEPNHIENVNRALAYGLGADASAWDINQVLRPPGTINHKRQTPVGVVARSNSTVEVSHFESLPATPEPAVQFTLQDIPDVTSVVLKYAWPETVAELYRQRDFPVGSRSSAMMKLGYYLAEMGMTDAEMFSVLRNADDRWGKFKDRQDRDKRLVDLIQKARLKYPAEIVVQEDEIPLYGFRSFLNTEIHIEWLVEGILQQMGYMLLTGPSGVGKTQWSLRWAMHFAMGKDFMGYKIERPYRIAFFSCEMGHPDLKQFLTLMSEGLTEEELDLLEQNLILAPLGEPLYLDNPLAQQKFEGLLELLRPDGFFFDSIGSATSGELSSESVVKVLMDFNDRLRKKFNVFSWYIHHMRKATGDNKKPNKQADVYGNQYLVNRATTVYCLWPAPGAIEVIPLKKRLAPLEESWFITRLANLDFMKKVSTVNFVSPVNHILMEPVAPNEGGEPTPPTNGFLQGL